MKIIKCSNGNVSLVLTENIDVTDKVIRTNSVDASFEKHVPQYERKQEDVQIFVNHVMEDDHYIEWILVDYGNEQILHEFKPGDEAKIVVKYHEGMKAYSYCNKHGLWVNEEII